MALPVTRVCAAQHSSRAVFLLNTYELLRISHIQRKYSKFVEALHSRPPRCGTEGFAPRVAALVGENTRNFRFHRLAQAAAACVGTRQITNCGEHSTPGGEQLTSSRLLCPVQETLYTVSREVHHPNLTLHTSFHHSPTHSSPHRL